jgi:hypothetical protein
VEENNGATDGSPAFVEDIWWVPSWRWDPFSATIPLPFCRERYVCFVLRRLLSGTGHHFVPLLLLAGGNRFGTTMVTLEGESEGLCDSTGASVGTTIGTADGVADGTTMGPLAGAGSL